MICIYALGLQVPDIDGRKTVILDEEDVVSKSGARVLEGECEAEAAHGT